MKKNYFFKELVLFYALFALAVYFVYFQRNFSLLYFLLLLGISWFAKNDYFWFAFFFLIMQTPGWFFWDFATSRLPGFTILAGTTLTPIDLFTVLILFKGIFHNKLNFNLININLKFPLLLLFAYFIFSFFNGLIIHNGTLDVAGSFLRGVAYFSWIFSFMAFVDSKEKVFKFLKLLLPISFFILFTQVYFLLNKIEFISLFDPFARVEEVSLNTLTGELRPYPGGISLLVLNCFSTLVFLNLKGKEINRPYIYLSLGIIFFSILISATRFLFGIFLFTTAGVFFIRIKNLSKAFLFILVILLIISMFIKLGIISPDYLRNSAWGRVSQIFTLNPEEIKGIDTFEDRLVQLEILLEKIKQSPLFGYGFSDISYRYYNCNWGFWNTILIFGLFGFFLHLFLFYAYYKMMWHVLAHSYLYKKSDLLEAIRVLLVSFFALLIAYFLTWDCFSIYFYFQFAFFMVFLAISMNFIKFLQSAETAP